MEFELIELSEPVTETEEDEEVEESEGDSVEEIPGWKKKFVFVVDKIKVTVLHFALPLTILSLLSFYVKNKFV